MHCRQLVHLKESLSAAPVPECEMCRLRMLDHDDLQNRCHRVAHTIVKVYVPEQRHGPRMQRLHDERLRDGSHDGRLLRPKSHDRLPAASVVNHGAAETVLGRNERRDLECRDAEGPDSNRTDGDPRDVVEERHLEINGLLRAAEQRAIRKPSAVEIRERVVHRPGTTPLRENSAQD